MNGYTDGPPGADGSAGDELVGEFRRAGAVAAHHLADVVPGIRRAAGTDARAANFGIVHRASPFVPRAVLGRGVVPPLKPAQASEQ